MAESIFEESSFRFTDPVRLFKANDPYYFEVDNIPLKQLQENCLWLKDQMAKKVGKLRGVKRSDIDELRPYATGDDRVVRVKPGRYSARINDASIKNPLAFLKQVMGDALGDVDAWATATANNGSFPTGTVPSFNTRLQAALDTFKSTLSEYAMGMTGLTDRAFTWPVVTEEDPVEFTGVKVTSDGYLQYGNTNSNMYGSGARFCPMLITEALLWAKSFNDTASNYILPTFETTNINSGFAKLPYTESHLIKKWRGVARLAIVDVDDEITVNVPAFDPADFSYYDEDGQLQLVQNVQSRIDMVFIYSKPVDVSGVNVLRSGGVETITKPTLGIVRGAGLCISDQGTTLYAEGTPQGTTDEHKILASPSDQYNEDMGFNSTSANDIAYDVRGSFPSPDDLLNIAPLISEKLEAEAYELVGQSILPVAYVWVKESGTNTTNAAIPILSTDVIDIRPFFRTAELAYNERTGIAAAMPQLSLANPAVGKAQLDLEAKRLFDYINSKSDQLQDEIDNQTQGGVVATGYVFGGWNFGPEGALFDFYQTKFAADSDTGNDSVDYIKQYIRGKYGIGNQTSVITVPDYPDWDLSQWCLENDLSDKGLYPNDYVNTFVSQREDFDNSIAAGSYREKTNADGTGPNGSSAPGRLRSFSNTDANSDGGTGVPEVRSSVNFHYISKTIKFNREAAPWLADYKVDVTLTNCLPQATGGQRYGDAWPANYFGTWVEKGFDEFTSYVAFMADDNNRGGNLPLFPAPHSFTTTSGGKKKTTTTTTTVSERDGGRFSGFIVMTDDILYSDTSPIGGTGKGYQGNPRVGKCTYPTVMWSLTAISSTDAPYHYGNLNGTNPVITLKP